MKKLKIIIMAVCMVCMVNILAISAHAAGFDISPYISAKIGGGIASSLQIPTSTPLGGGVMGAIGVKYGLSDMNLRGEFEISKFYYKDNKKEDEYPFSILDSSYKLDSTLYLTNFYIDFLMRNQKINPYVGIGLGMINFKEKAHENLYFYGSGTNIPTEAEREKTVPAFGPSVGFEFNIVNGVEGDVSARCMVFVVDDRIIICSANFGLRYTF